MEKQKPTQHKPKSVAPWPAYKPQAIEPKWQQYWEEHALYRTLSHDERPKFYCLDYFPYPSGEGLHVGHCRNYIPTDLLSRYKRMLGFNVLHPMGWDSFGEPAEQFAITQGVHPRLTTDRNTATYRRQMTIIGCSYDWSREIDSSKPEFYRWTQWFFLLLYQRGLAYRDTHWQWWCPTCQTTLSSHEAAGGVCWRGHPNVTKREIPAWYFRITAYADELISGLDEVDWPEKIKLMQRNWIGRSEGAEVQFTVFGVQYSVFSNQLPENSDQVGQESDENKSQNTEYRTRITVFTTRPDTLFGATFLVLAPEHPLVSQVTTPEQKPVVEAYIQQTLSQSEIQREAAEKEKSGVFTGGYAINPVNGERIPIWIADYVLMSYGSGAIMAVPAHDQRDLEFARKYHLPIRVVITSPNFVQGKEPEEVYTGHGIMTHSGQFTGLASEEGMQRVIAWLEERGLGKRQVQYRMHDWLISRQRYWGTPIPILHCPTCGMQPVPADQLPVLLPAMQNFQPDGSGRSPLARLPEFVDASCPQCGGPAQRETDTMGGFACSSWYFLRFINPGYGDQAHGPIDPRAVPYWMPVDLYVGGAEHAVLHLLYARFWTKVMADAGLITFREPFAKLLNQGMLMGPDGKRMSKSRGNVIIPDTVVADHGADALRVYELFMAPFDQDIDWSTKGIQGSRRFLNRLWSLYGHTYQSCREAIEHDPELERKLHQTIRRVSQRMEDFRFNTMVSSLMEFVNALYDRYSQDRWRTQTFFQALETLMALMAPIAPHICEELWRLTGHAGSVHQQSWPRWDEELAREEVIQLPVQVNGKLREVIEVTANTPQEEVEILALGQSKVKQYLAGAIISKIVYIPGKIINIVTKAA